MCCPSFFMVVNSVVYYLINSDKVFGTTLLNFVSQQAHNFWFCKESSELSSRFTCFIVCRGPEVSSSPSSTLSPFRLYLGFTMANWIEKVSLSLIFWFCSCRNGTTNQYQRFSKFFQSYKSFSKNPSCVIDS